MFQPTAMKLYSAALLTTAAALLLELPSAATAGTPSHVVVDESGVVHVPAFDIPLSSYMSEQAKKSFIDTTHHSSASDPGPSASVSEVRESVDKEMRKRVKHLESLYPVNVEEQRVGGVRTDVVTPKDGIPPGHNDRVLINLHGGGFEVGAVWHGLAESIPVSSIGKFKVITVDYRMAPEYQFPAASEDVASVFNALLKQYRAENIGIYGCSAGGSLSAMAVAWLQKEGKPTPGAIGILSAAAFAGFAAEPTNHGSWGGDSRFLAPALVGKKLWVGPMPYLNKVDLRDPLVSPGVSPFVLAKFPPTLLVTGTRAFDMSAAVQTQRELTKVGVEADLHLWDGMGHCFFMDEDLPESREAYDVVAKFFDSHLGKKK